MNESKAPLVQQFEEECAAIARCVCAGDFEAAFRSADWMAMCLKNIVTTRKDAALVQILGVAVPVPPQPQPRLELDARAVDEVVRRLAGIVEDRVNMARPLLEHIERRQGDLANEVFKLAELIRAKPKSTAETLGAAIVGAAGGTGGGSLVQLVSTPYAPKAAGGPVARQSNDPAPRRWWWNSLQAIATGLAAGAIFYGSMKALQVWLHW